MSLPSSAFRQSRHLNFTPFSRSVRFFSARSRILSPVELVFDKYDPPNHGGGEPAGSGARSSEPSLRHPPIIFLHGLFGSRKNNRTMSKILARDLSRTVYALDLRNHGDSPHTAEHSYNAMAEDVEHFIARHGLATPSLIGHSMGAKVAMAVALRNPALLESVVSVDNAPVDAALKSDFPAYLRAMKAVERAGVRKQSEADEVLQKTIPELPIRQFILTNMFRPPPSAGSSDPGSRSDTYRFRIPLDTLTKSLEAMGDFPFKVPDGGSSGLPSPSPSSSSSTTNVADKPVRFVKPALFVRGTRSRYMSDETIPIIGRFFPLFKLADIDAGHWVISENPGEFRKAVVRFYEDLQDD